MKNLKKLSLNKILAILLMPLVILATVFGLCFKDKSASALPAYPSEYIGPIYNFDSLNYEEEKLNELASKILGNGKTIQNLIDYIKSDAQEGGMSVSHARDLAGLSRVGVNNLTVAYGRYNTAQPSTPSYVPLIWMPVYMSTTADGKDAVLTLYLAACNGSRTSFEYGSFTWNGEYTNVPQCASPSNMYGTSYMRAHQLGNGGKFMNYEEGHGANASPNTAVIDVGGNNKFLEFQQYRETDYFGDTVSSMGYLYEDIVAPSQIAWQADESYKDIIGDTGEFYDIGATSPNTMGGAAWENYKFPNEAYGNSNGDYTNSNYDYSDRAGYDSWKNDKVWLPSLTEVGTGDHDGTTNTLNGLWELTKIQKANNPTGLNPVTAAWLRTPNTTTDCYSMFTLEQDGNVATRQLSEKNIQIRPAIHLNLSKIITKYRQPVNVPSVVSVQYNGEAQTLKNGEVDWMKEEISVSFYTDKECKNAVTPVNYGEYYLKVYLENPSDYFAKLPFEQKDKTVRFVVEKKQIGVTWTYDGNKPIDIALSSDSVIYNRDIVADFVPEIGIKYTSSTGSGVTYYDYDDVLKGSYYAEAYIIDEDKYNYNYVLSPDKITVDKKEIDNPDKVGESLKSNTFAVGRKEVDMPYFVGTEPGTLTHRIYYKGDQYVQIANINPDYFTVTVTSPLNRPCELIGVSEQGYLTYKVSERDDYTFNFKFKKNTQFTWSDSGYVWAPINGGTNVTESNYDADDRKLTLELRRAELDLEFVGLAAEWSTITEQKFSVAVHGIYVQDADNPIELSVYYLRAGQSVPVYVTANSEGLYVLRNLLKGEYTIYVSLANGSAYANNYTVPGNFKAQPFKVIEVVSSFNESLIKWQYTHGTTTQGEYEYYEHDKENTALEFFYDGDFYQFSLTLNELQLRDMYYVKAVYSGAKFVKDAGSYKITVDIKPYYSGVKVDEVSCDLYFKIKPVKYNLSALEWDYDIGSPFTYNGAKKKVAVTTDSLAGYPGLTVEYTTEGNRIDAGTYTTKAKFIISEPYAINYILPLEEDDTTYDGEFPFNCTWTIGKAKLEIEWNMPSSDTTSSITYIPTLKFGHEFVTYSYEKKVVASWIPVTELKADGANETFRAMAVLKDEYAINYEIENSPYSDEFEVESGKQAVSVHYEANGKVVDDGAQFAYTGKALELELVVDSGGLSVDSYTFKYYAINGSLETELNGAPFDVGKYAAEVTAQYNDGSYVSSGTPRITFEIVKADYDPTQIWWIYQHGDTTLAGRYDKEQGKWVNDKGEEVEFTFEYDGTPHMLTLSLQQEFDDPADAITIDKVLGNSATSAGNYTATVDFIYNSLRFNDPYINGDDGVFPRTLSWKINKQKLDYNNVQWGYFDAQGKEHKFNFDQDSFYFTRDKNGVVGYTVGLIGLPQGIQDLITYSTQDLSVVGSIPELGNTRANVGEYITSYTISGTWSDPNYEDFDAANFPLTIFRTQKWEIRRRELTEIDYKGNWTVFDDRVHNVVDLCNIPLPELPYFKIEVTFMDKLSNVYNDYQGYNDVPNALYHAGEYQISLYQIVGEEETLVIFDSVVIKVEKNKLNVSWSLDGDYPVVRVKDVYATNMVGTLYLRTDGAEVPLAYVKSTNGDEEFTARACVTDAYRRDIEITELEDVKFYYSPFIPDEFTEAIDKPKMVEAEMYYTGEPITFAIDAWSYYSKFIYIADGNLTQTEIGTYYIVVRFYKKDNIKGIGNAYWKGSSSTNGDYDRESYTLSFTILPPTEWPLEYPILEPSFAQWTDDYIEFNIVNWVALSAYLDYEVFYGGESLGTSETLVGGLSFKHGGLYTIVFTIPDDSVGYWKDNALDPKGTYTLQFRIFGDPNVKDEVEYPTLDRITAEYDGTEKQFKIKSWDGYFVNFITLSCNDPNVRITGGIITASIPGSYNITATTKQGYTFEGGKTTYTITIGILNDGNGPISKPSFTKSEQEYTGEELEFVISGWAGLYADDLELSCDNPAVTIDNARGIIKVTNFGEYIIRVSIKEGSGVYWAGTNSDRSPFDLKIKVNANVGDDKAVPPSITVPELQYNGNVQTFVVGNFDGEKVTIVEGADVLKQKEVGTYRITFRLINPDKVTWLDGTTDDIVVEFKIVPAKISDIDIGENGKPIVKDENGNPIPDFNVDDLIDVIYKDKDGNIVKKEDLKPGESYTVEFVVKNPEDFDNKIENGAAIRDKIDQGNSEGKYVINIYTPDKDPSENKDSDGMNPLWWIAIAAGILAVIAILGVIIGLATRNNGGGYDDGYGYDDYYDDYDDEDEDYDDEDDYDDYDDEYGDYDDYGDGYDEY